MARTNYEKSGVGELTVVYRINAKAYRIKDQGLQSAT